MGIFENLGGITDTLDNCTITYIIKRTKLKLNKESIVPKNSDITIAYDPI